MTPEHIEEQYTRVRVCRRYEASLYAPDSTERRQAFAALESLVRRAGRFTCDGWLYQWSFMDGSFLRSRVHPPHVAREGPGIRVVKTPMWLKESDSCYPISQ